MAVNQLTNVTKRALRLLRLHEPAKALAVRLGVRESDEHGHALMLRAMRGYGGPLDGATLIEIGSTRELLPGQGSTAVLAAFCERRGLGFVTVDMDPANAEQAASTVRSINPRFRAVAQRGEDFLAEWSGDLSFVYLDAFDIDHGQHSDDRKRRYEEHLGVEITNDACAAMHLECATVIADRMVASGLVVIDDTWQEDGRWMGKGATAVPFLLRNGFTELRRGNGAVALIKTE